nr:MAG TPA: zinc-ribbon domain protein [Caudoviricetes sp.]
MYCTNCGKKNHDGAKFCINCGKPIAPEKPVSPPTEEEKEVKREKKRTIIMAVTLCVLGVLCAVVVFWRLGLLGKIGLFGEKSETAIARDKVVEICEAYLDGEYTEDEAKYMLDLVEIPNTTGGENLETYVGILKTRLGLMSLPFGESDTSEFERIVDNVKKLTVDYPALDAEREAEAATQTATPETAMSAARNSADAALEDAYGYIELDIPVSYDMLVEQLVYEGYSEDVATYAADNCGADWYAQALKGAQYTLDHDHSDISYDALVMILEAYGFTEDQAVYGADQVLNK